MLVGQGVKVAVGCKEGIGIMVKDPLGVGLPRSIGKSGTSVETGVIKSGVSWRKTGNDAEGVGLRPRRFKI